MCVFLCLCVCMCVRVHASVSEIIRACRARSPLCCENGQRLDDVCLVLVLHGSLQLLPSCCWRELWHSGNCL